MARGTASTRASRSTRLIERPMERLFRELLGVLEPGRTLDVKLGLHWTMVTVQVGDDVRSGLATTMPSVGHHHRDRPDVQQPGHLEAMDARVLAGLIASPSPVERSIGLAAINALLPRKSRAWVDLNAEEVIADAGAGKGVAMVGHFPFAERLRLRVGRLWVLELDPRGDDLPASRAPEIIPQADVLAITSVTLLNHTLADLLALRRPRALTLLMGPSTPMSPILYDWGVDILSGSVVTDAEAVRVRLCQGAGFRQLHKAGVRLVTMRRR